MWCRAKTLIMSERHNEISVIWNVHGDPNKPIWCVTITPALCFLGWKIQRRNKRDKRTEKSLVTVSLTDRVRAQQVYLPVCHWAGRCTDGQDWTPCLSGSACPPPQSLSHTAKRSRPAAGSHPRGSETNTKGMTIIKKTYL